ncbi:MAG: major facilitator transporter [Methylibium sp. NZG]|nr:MAG: major facilitator transporter [Methylibium sp. NZG]
MPLTAATRQGMSPAVVVAMLVLMLGIQPVTTDLYLPSMASLPGALGTTVGAAQLTLSVLIICFGVAQLVCGPLADRFGRRPVLLIGLAIYTVASVLAALAPTIGWLIAWRGLQGAAMAAAVTGGRSIVRDLFEPQEGARVMSKALGGLGTIALLCPIIGGALMQWFDWRVSFVAVALFGAGALAFVAWRFEETVPQRNPDATRLAPLWRNWKQIVRHPTFVAYTLLLSSTYGGLFIILAASSFVYIDVLGLSRWAYGVVLASNSAAYIVGTVLCRHLLTRRGLRATVALGGGLSLSGGVLLAGLSLAGAHAWSVWTIIVPLWLYSLGHGIHQPCGQAGAVGPFRDKAGTAASLSGFCMMVTAFLIGLWLGWSLNGTVFPLTLGVAAFSVVVAGVAWTLVQRHGDPQHGALRAA